MIKRTKNNKKKGFTLIELIIVLAVLAIIALIAIPNFIAVRDNSKVKSDKQSLETIRRNTLALVADGTIPTTTGGNYFIFGDDGAKTPATDLVSGSDPYKALQSMLKDTKKPQYKSGNFYRIQISSTGDVSTIEVATNGPNDLTKVHNDLEAK